MMPGRSDRTRIAIVAGLLLSLTPCLATSRLALVAGDDAPVARGLTPDREFHMVRYEPGTVTIINFWATWCVPCRDEMPALSDLYDRRGPEGMRVFGVHAGYAAKEELEDFLEQVSVGFPILLPDDQMLRDWGGITVMPTTFLVDGQGKILRRYIGATRAQIEGLIFDAEAALDGRPLGPVILPPGRPEVASDDSAPPAP